MATIGVLKPASVTPLTSDEIERATSILDKDGVCVSLLQRKMQIGWNRAADLIEHIKGRDALPAVALMRETTRKYEK